MQHEVVISGFGGQGVLFTGKMLTYAGMQEGKEVTWFPSYGPAMRGGTASCTVVISDEEIGSPQVLNPTTAIVMNQPSLDKYEDLVLENGYLVVNTSMVNREAARQDVNIVAIPGTEIAEDLGNPQLANCVLLGALAAEADFINLSSLEKALEKTLSSGKKNLLEINIAALNRGYNSQQELRK